MIVDTHLHVVDQNCLSYPWLADAPALNRNFSYREYAAEARRLGITSTLHMEVDVAESQMAEEIDNVTAIAALADSLVVGAIAACRPEDAGFAAYLEQVRSKRIVKGFRRVLHIMPDGLSEQSLFRENIKRLAGTGLTFDLVVLPRQLPQAMALVDLAPDVQFVLDHCGVPDIKGGAMHPWKEHMTEIARRPNVVGKISGVCAYADSDNWTVETLRPWVEHTISSFGWNRVVWGSDWPVCTLAGSLSTWVGATHALIAGASSFEKAGLLSTNAKKLWSLPG